MRRGLGEFLDVPGLDASNIVTIYNVTPDDLALDWRVPRIARDGPARREPVTLAPPSSPADPRWREQA